MISIKQACTNGMQKDSVLQNVGVQVIRIVKKLNHNIQQSGKSSENAN